MYIYIYIVIKNDDKEATSQTAVTETNT